MFDLPIRKWKTLLYILLSRGSAADKIFVLWTSVVSFLGWTINLMSIYPRTCMLSVLINSITWGKSSYLNDVIRVPRPGTLMMSFLLLAPCQMWSQNKTLFHPDTQSAVAHPMQQTEVCLHCLHTQNLTLQLTELNNILVMLFRYFLLTNHPNYMTN